MQLRTQHFLLTYFKGLNKGYKTKKKSQSVMQELGTQTNGREAPRISFLQEHHTLFRDKEKPHAELKIYETKCQ